MKTLTLVNPSQTIQRFLKKWEIGSGYVLTCRSSTCNCMSHDSGYDWVEYSLPDGVFKYLSSKINHFHGSPSSHKCCSWAFPKLERELKDRGEHAAECARYVIEAENQILTDARCLPDFVVLCQQARELASAAFNNSNDNSIFCLRFEVQTRAEGVRQKEWEKKFARRDNVVFPLKGNGWNFIPA